MSLSRGFTGERSGGSAGDMFHAGLNRRAKMRGGMLATRSFLSRNPPPAGGVPPSAARYSVPVRSADATQHVLGAAPDFAFPKAVMPGAPSNAAAAAAGAGAAAEPLIRPPKELHPLNACFTTIIPYLSHYYPEFSAVLIKRAFVEDDIEDDLYDEGEGEGEDGGELEDEADEIEEQGEGLGIFAVDAPLRVPAFAVGAEAVDPYPDLMVPRSEYEQLQFIRTKRVSDHTGQGRELGRADILEDFVLVCDRVFPSTYLRNTVIHSFPDDNRESSRAEDRSNTIRMDTRFTQLLELVQTSNWAGVLELKASRHDPRSTTVRVYHVIPFVAPPRAKCIQFFDPQTKHGRPLTAIDMLLESDVEEEKYPYVLSRQNFIRMLHSSQRGNLRGTDDGSYDLYVSRVMVLRREAQTLPRAFSLVSRHTGGRTLLSGQLVDRERQLSLLTRPDDLINDILRARPIGHGARDAAAVRASLEPHYMFDAPAPGEPDPNSTIEDIQRNFEEAKHLVYGGRAIQIRDPYNIYIGRPDDRKITATLQPNEDRGDVFEVTVELNGLQVNVDRYRNFKVEHHQGFNLSSQANAQQVFYNLMSDFIERLNYSIVEWEAEPRIAAAEPVAAAAAPAAAAAAPAAAAPAAAAAADGSGFFVEEGTQ